MARRGGEKNSTAKLASDIDYTQGLDLFQKIPALNTLRLSEEVGSFISRALHGLSMDSATEVLPALRDLSLEGRDQFSSIREAMTPFLSVRHQRSDHTVVVCRRQRWREDFRS